MQEDETTGPELVKTAAGMQTYERPLQVWSTFTVFGSWLVGFLGLHCYFVHSAFCDGQYVIRSCSEFFGCTMILFLIPLV